MNCGNSHDQRQTDIAVPAPALTIRIDRTLTETNQ